MSLAVEYASNEYALSVAGVSQRDLLRSKMRYAPDHIKRAFPTVFPELATSKSPPAKSRFGTSPRGVTAKSPAMGFLVGSVAPGLSESVRNSLDGQTVPEVFSRAAWRSILADVKEGRRVDLRFRHEGVPVASTAMGTLRFEIHNTVGLMFEARFNADDPNRNIWFHAVPAGGADVSVAFRKCRSKLVTFRNQTVRLIHHAELDHVAVINPASGSHGSYRSAHVVAVRGGDREALRDAWTRVRVKSWETSKQHVRLTDLESVTS